MFQSLFARLKASFSQVERRASHPTRGLRFETFESRALMATIPVLNSLPGAPRTLYLDFDGDFQSVWNRTDSGQTYNNVNVGQFNLDNTLGFSDAEAATMQKIWETVSEDYAPFNINVTTVAPASFANGVAMRVVMAGSCSAQLKTGPNTSINISGDRFIADNAGNLVDTSGYSAIGSFTNGEPNVVYVFAKYINTWGTIDSEGRARDLKYVMATTASHEAGHSFGLVHHGDYDVGTNVTTPIMGSNTQGDRSIWSSYKVGNVTHDNLVELTNVLGTRADDFSNNYSGAGNFQFNTSSPIFGISGSVKGVVTSATDTDWFRFSSNGGTYQFNVNTLQFANLDARLEIYKVTRILGFTFTTLIIAEDPQVNSFNPFSNLGVSFAANLAVGDYAVVVRSHGGYGDLGNYTLRISQASNIVISPTVAAQSLSSAGAGAGLPGTSPPNLAAVAQFAGAGQGNNSTKKSNQAAVDHLLAAW